MGFDNLIPYFRFVQNALNKKDIFFVGGLIRDILLNLRTDNFKDIDVALEGNPLEIYVGLDQSSGSIFKTDKFGTITIVRKSLEESSEEDRREIKNVQFEITPFREESIYSDSRHPDELKWTDNLISDSIRRDFTINALYYRFWERSEEELGEVRREQIKWVDGQVFDLREKDLDEEKFLKVLKNKGYALILQEKSKPILIVQNHNLIEKIVKQAIEFDLDKLHIILDPQKGINDIVNQKLRAVGNPDDRVQEDALRIIRGIRFISILNIYNWINLDFEKKTWLSMKKYYFLLRKIPKERIVQEMKKVFKNGNAFSFISLMDELNVLKFYFPALFRCKHNDQPTRYHPFDTYSHSLLALFHLQQINKNYLVRFGMLYHDVGKPDQYYWASIKKDEASQQQLYKLPIVHSEVGTEYTQEDFSKLGFSKKEVKEITFYVKYHMFPGELLNMSINKKKKEIKKFISNYGLEKLLNLCDIAVGDRLGQYNPLQHSDIEGIYKLKKEIKQIYEESGRITLKDLEINGYDLIKIVGKPGPLIGQILNKLLELVLEEKLENKKEILLEKAKDIMKEIGRNSEEIGRK